MPDNYKTILLIRHAKSSWGTELQTDFDRPLNDRGKKDAPEMAQRLKNRNINIDALISSPAKRAKKTSEFFATIYDIKKENIILIPQLYHANVDTFFDVIEELNNNFNTVAIFSHNPGITEFATQIIKDIIIDNMPTCAVFAVKVNIQKWSEFRNTRKEFLFFDYPQNI